MGLTFIALDSPDAVQKWIDAGNKKRTCITRPKGYVRTVGDYHGGESNAKGAPAVKKIYGDAVEALGGDPALTRDAKKVESWASRRKDVVVSEVLTVGNMVAKIKQAVKDSGKPLTTLVICGHGTTGGMYVGMGALDPRGEALIKAGQNALEKEAKGNVANWKNGAQEKAYFDLRLQKRQIVITAPGEQPNSAVLYWRAKLKLLQKEVGADDANGCFNVFFLGCNTATVMNNVRLIDKFALDLQEDWGGQPAVRAFGAAFEMNSDDTIAILDRIEEVKKLKQGQAWDTGSKSPSMDPVAGIKKAFLMSAV